LSNGARHRPVSGRVSPGRHSKQARQLAQAGQPGEASGHLAADRTDRRAGIARALQGMALRAPGRAASAPPEDLASLVLGAVAEVPVKRSHDVARPPTGTGTRPVPSTTPAKRCDLGRPGGNRHPGGHRRLARTPAQGLARVIGTWEQPSPATAPAGHLRVLMLTPSGPRFGQGPEADVRNESGPRTCFLTTGDYPHAAAYHPRLGRSRPAAAVSNPVAAAPARRRRTGFDLLRHPAGPAVRIC